MARMGDACRLIACSPKAHLGAIHQHRATAYCREEQCFGEVTVQRSALSSRVTGRFVFAVLVGFPLAARCLVGLAFGCIRKSEGTTIGIYLSLRMVFTTAVGAYD